MNHKVSKVLENNRDNLLRMFLFLASYFSKNNLLVKSQYKYILSQYIYYIMLGIITCT
jgi:hypothetical protein